MTTQNPSQPGDLFFQPIVESYLSNPRFLRRDWLATQVDERLGMPGCRFVLLTAAPGAGKSTFMAQLAADHPDWPRYFIRRDQRTPLGDVGAHSLLLRIGFQLAARHPEAFSHQNLELAVQQRIGIAEAGSEVVGAEVKRIVASPFYRKVLTIQQEIAQSGGRVVGLRVEELVVESQLLDLSQLVNMAIVDPARALLKLHPDDRIVILVDALDETRYHDTQDNILKWLTNCPELPPNVRFVLSSRPSDTALLTFCEKQKPYLQALTIRPDDAHVQDDARAYVRKLVARPDIAQEVARAGQTVQGFADQATAKARGNLGYLDALARAVDSALARTDDQGRATLSELLTLRDLPDEIEGLYAFFLRQIKTAVARERVELIDPETGESYDKPVWAAVYGKILGVLAVALAPLTLSQMSDLGGIAVASPDLADAVDRLRQFLEEASGHFRLYHATMAQFITDTPTRDGTGTADLYVDHVEWHGKVARSLWETHHHDWTTCDDYGLNSLPTHLARSEDTRKLRVLLLDLAWLQAKLDATGVTSLLADYDLLPDDPDLRLVQEAIRQASHVLLKDRMQLFPQLYGRLMTQQSPAIQDMRAGQPSGLWLRPLTAALTQAGSAMMQKIHACDLGINQLVLMPGGRQVLAANRDGRAVVWDLQRGAEVRSLPVGATSMGLTLDGSRLVYDWDGRLFVCDVESGATSLFTQEARAPFAIMPDSLRLVAAMRHSIITPDYLVEYRLSVRDLQTGAELYSLPGHACEITTLAAMPDGRRVVSGSTNGELRVWDLERQAEVAQLKPYDSPITAVLAVPDGRHIVVAAGGQGLVSVWDVERLPVLQLSTRSAAELPTGEAPELVWACDLVSAIRAIALTPDGARLVLGLGNGNVHILDWQARRTIPPLPGHEQAVSAVVVTPDNRRLVSSSVDGTLKIWDLDREFDPVPPHPGHAAPVNGVAISNDGRIALTAAGALDRQDNTLRRWDLDTGVELLPPCGHLSPVKWVLLLPDGHRAVSCSSDTGRGDADTRLWDVETGAPLGGPFPWRGEPKALAMTPDGRHLIGAFSNFASLLRLDDGADRMLCCHDMAVCAVAVTRDGRFALTASNDGWVQVRDLDTGEGLSPFQGHSLSINTLGIATDDRLVIVGSNDPCLAIWDWRSGVPLTPLEGHEGPVSTFAVVPNGRHILSGSMDGAIILWDVETRSLVHMREPCGDPVRAIAVAAGGQHAVSASDDEVLTVWDLAGRCRLASFYTDRPVQECAISPDGTTVIAGDEDGLVTILRLDGTTHAATAG